MTVLEHKVTAVDTIQSLAVKYYGDASRWRDIVDFNNLDYPYLTSDPNFQAITYASGIVAVVRPYTNGVLTIPQGTIFAVPPSDGFPSRQYKSLMPVTLQLGVNTAEIPVQCDTPGLWGDVTQGAISTIVTADPVLKSAFTTIGNPYSIDNGNVKNVRMLGDALLIPLDDQPTDGVIYADVQSFYEAQFGSDLTLGDDGDLVFDGYGSIGSVSGIPNLAQAARDRCLTPKLSLVYHPDYGQYLDQFVGKPAAPFTQKMISLALMETLLNDDRIDRVNVVSLDQSGTTLNAVIDIYPIQQSDAIRVPISLPSTTVLIPTILNY